jgi:pimeloyl-ACP methyl ester carboxylesterase
MGQPDGTPLFYFHGNPGSRLDFNQTYNRPALDDTGMRIIGIDRPGFGGSTFQPRRQFADWPRDVLAVADELGIDTFGVLAYSGGGPYAIACALAFPERLTFVGIISGDGPAETPRFMREWAPQTR